MSKNGDRITHLKGLYDAAKERNPAIATEHYSTAAVMIQAAIMIQQLHEADEAGLHYSPKWNGSMAAQRLYVHICNALRRIPEAKTSDREPLERWSGDEGDGWIRSLTAPPPGSRVCQVLRDRDRLVPLIVATPLLLAALKELVEDVERNAGAEDMAGAIDTDNAYAAIEAAGGSESPAPVDTTDE